MSVELLSRAIRALTLEEVRGVLAFHRANQKEVDAYIADGSTPRSRKIGRRGETNAKLIASWSERAACESDSGLTLDLDARIILGLRRIAPAIIDSTD